MGLSNALKYKLSMFGGADRNDPRRADSSLLNFMRQWRGPNLLSATTTDGSASSTSHNVNVGSPASGEIVVVAIRAAAAVTITMTGWTELWSNQENDRNAVFYRVCDGTEGASEVVTLSVATRLAAVALRFTNAGTPVIQGVPPRTQTTGSSLSNHPHGTGWGVRDNCFLLFAMAEGPSNLSSRPTGYDTASPQAGTITNTGSSGAGLATVHWTMKQTRASRDEAGPWTMSGVTVWTTFTVLIPPA